MVFREDKENYIGNWVTGFGFIDVKFPKSTTRELTSEEKDKYNGMGVAIGSHVPYIIETKKNPISRKAIMVNTRNTEYRFGKADREGVRTISRVGKPLDFKKCRILFLVTGRSMRFHPAGDPETIWTTSTVLSIK